MVAFAKFAGGSTVVAFVVGGVVVEGALVGASIGASDPLRFIVQLWLRRHDRVLQVILLHRSVTEETLRTRYGAQYVEGQQPQTCLLALMFHACRNAALLAQGRYSVIESSLNSEQEKLLDGTLL